MPLEAPNLDTRTFEDLLSEARLRIPRYNRDWTDFNESDPGYTLVQLFAWLTELMLVQFNQVPERNYIKFLQLMGIERRPAQAATAHLTFKATPGVATGSIDRWTQVVAQPEGGGEALIFETEAGLDLIRADLTELQVFDGVTFRTVTLNNQAGGAGFLPFGLQANRGSALYLGFSPPNPPPKVRIFPQQLRLRVFLSEPASAGLWQDANQTETAPLSPVQLVWEYHPAAEPTRWQPLNVYGDESLGFTREGYVQLQGPPEVAATLEGRVTEARYWLRVRLAGGFYPAGKVPLLDFIRFNTVPAIQLSTVREEVAGHSDGMPDQVFQLYRRPVVSKSLVISIESKGQPAGVWQQKEDFLHSKSDDSHYTFEGNTARIRFGDGLRGRIPPADAAIVARRYRYGGGVAGNVPGGAISGLPGNITGLDSVTNERPAVGGREEQSVEDLKTTAPLALKRRNRAVTIEDFCGLAMEAGGVAKATALARMHPSFPGVSVPGAVTVVVVPDNADLAPRPTADFLHSVSQYLNKYRLLTTELFVKGPTYKVVQVDVVVAARPYRSFATIARDVEVGLNFSLDPLARVPAVVRPSEETLRAAGLEEWQFGEAFHPTGLFSVVLGVDGVAYVKSLQVTVDGASRDIGEPVELPADGLLAPGSHRVTVVPG